PLMMCGVFGGAATAVGATTSKTWAHTPASLTADAFDLFTYEFGDDVLDDWYQFGDGIIESLVISAPVGLGPLSATMTWRFGSLTSTGSTTFPVTGTVPTPSLNVDRAPVPLYLKALGIWIDSPPGAIGTTAILNSLHNFTLTISRVIDQKRFANASQSFDLQAYGSGARTISLDCRFAKSEDIVGTGSESDSWMSSASVDRYIQLKATSKALASTGPDVPYSWLLQAPMRYYTRLEDAEGGNTVVNLPARAFLEPNTFAGVFKSTIVNKLVAAGI